LATLLSLLWQVRKFLASKKEEAGSTRGEQILSPYLSVENDVFFPALVHYKIVFIVVVLFFFSGPSIAPVMMLGAVIEDCFILHAHMMHFIFFFFFFFSGPCLAHQ
jgi:hypothetical protein